MRWAGPAWLGRTGQLAVMLVVALVGLAGASPARPADAMSSCDGRDLLPELRQSGKLAVMEKAVAGIRNGEGKFYRIAGPGRAPSFLYGTMHLSDPRLDLSPMAKARFASARTLVIETTDSLDSTAAAATLLARPDLLYLPPGKKIDDLLDQEQSAVVDAGLERRHIPPASVATLQPWFLAVSLMLPECETARLAAGDKPLDLKLAAAAKAVDKPVLGLETGAEQLEALASMSMALQLASLTSTLALGDRLPDLFETMTQLYLGGRIALITPLSEALLPPETEKAAHDAAEFEQRLVTDRNERMTERLLPLLQEGSAFVAVGALHLPGDQGLVALLRAKGFQLTRLD